MVGIPQILCLQAPLSHMSTQWQVLACKNLPRVTLMLLAAGFDTQNAPHRTSVLLVAGFECQNAPRVTSVFCAVGFGKFICSTVQSFVHVTVQCDVVHSGCSSILLALPPEVQLQSPEAWAGLSRTWFANAVVLEPILDVRTRLRALFEVNMRRDQHQCYSRRILACQSGQKLIMTAQSAGRGHPIPRQCTVNVGSHSGVTHCMLEVVCHCPMMHAGGLVR